VKFLLFNVLRSSFYFRHPGKTSTPPLDHCSPSVPPLKIIPLVLLIAWCRSQYLLKLLTCFLLVFRSLLYALCEKDASALSSTFNLYHARFCPSRVELQNFLFFYVFLFLPPVYHTPSLAASAPEDRTKFMSSRGFYSYRGPA